MANHFRKVRASLFAGLALATLLALPAASIAKEKKIGEAFADPMAALVPERWYVADGIEAGQAKYDPKNVSFDSGHLALTLNDVLKDQLHPFSAGQLQTRVFYNFGRAEAKIKTDKIGGTDTAFYTYTGPTQGDPWDEIDFEFLGKDTTKVSVSYFAGGKSSADSHTVVVDLGFDASKDFHTYAIEWQAKYIRWFVDGKMVREVTDAAGPLPSHSMKIICDFWPGSAKLNGWLGEFKYPGKPLQAHYKDIAYAPVAPSATGK